MSAIDSIKRLPRWTWYTAAGVSAGALALKFWKGRDADPASATAGDGTSTGDAMYPGSTQTAIGSSPGVIVPPIITGGSDDVSGLFSGFAGLFGGTIDDLTGLVGSVVAGNQETTQGLIGLVGQQSAGILDVIAGAGVAPQPVAQQPPVVNVNLPAPAAPPAQQGPAKTCGQAYPSYPIPAGADVASPGNCFKIGCNSKNHVTRYYKSGRVDVLSPAQKCG